MFLTFLFSIVEVVTVTCGGGTHAWRTRFWGGSGCFCQRCVMLFLELRARVGTSVCQRSWGRSDHSKITIPPPPHLILGRSPVGELEFKNFKCQEWISKARGCVCDYINKIFITFLL